MDIKRYPLHGNIQGRTKKTGRHVFVEYISVEHDSDNDYMK